MLETDLELHRGDFALRSTAVFGAGTTGLFGRSGAGKSSLLLAVAGLLTPQRGSIVLDEETLFDSARRICVPAHRRRIGVVFQDGRLFPHFNVAGNLRYGAPPDPPTALSFTSVVEMLELAPLLHRRPVELSGGERQRVALGRALLSAPRLLLLDEPLASLDFRAKREIVPFIRRIESELALPILYVAHDLSELLQLTEQLVLLDSGAVSAAGSLGELALGRSAAPLSRDLVNVIRMTVVRHNPEAGTTLLARDATEVVAPCWTDVATDAEVTVVVRPEDIAIALHRVDGISTRNQLRGTVRRLAETEGQVTLEVDVGFSLLVQVTRHTAEQLALAPDRAVWCLIKSNALKRW